MTPAGLSRKSLGAVRFESTEVSPSSTMSPSRRRRSIAVSRVVEPNIEENDDEAERIARRERNENGSPAAVSASVNDRRQSTVNLSAISNLPAAEIHNQIAQCIKLSNENKINDKNAFQLKLIDFLLYTLKKQDPNMTNLQMASASLDASAKIYGFRVDKVHSDLLKILGMTKQDKRDHQDEDGNNESGDQPDEHTSKVQQKKKKKKNRQHIINTVEALKGNIEIYDPLSLIRYQRDTQTSDMLFQAGLPQHTNQGVALNLYNDVILDKISSTNNKPSPKIMTHLVDDFTNQEISPSYAAFKFLDWSPDDEPEELNNQNEENDGEYHFDLDADVPDDDFINHDMTDCGDEERWERLAQNNPAENIVDFQDIIANNPNPNATYEYSYLHKSYRIRWAGPSHWKITLNRNLSGSRVIETCKQNVAKKKKEIELFFTIDSKEEDKIKFCENNRQTKLSSKTTKLWSVDKVTFPQDIHYDLKRYYSFFNKPTEYLKFPNTLEEVRTCDNGSNFDHTENDISNADALDNGEHFGDKEEERFTQDNNIPEFTQENIATQSQGAFIGDNLVSAPKLTDKVFIPYSQRAKKIDMRQIKKAMWKNLKKTKDMEKENFDITQAVESESNKDIEPKLFSDMYSELPKNLSKLNAASISPSIAFVALLHLANEKSLKIDRNIELSDLSIKSGKND